MDERTKHYLREIFHGEPPFVRIPQTGGLGLCWRDLMEQLVDGAEEVFLSVMATLFREHDAPAWLCYTDEDLELIAQAKVAEQTQKN
jgi:hypothetical protein